MNSLIEWIFGSDNIKMILRAFFVLLISWLSFCNGENIGKFLYIILH